MTDQHSQDLFHMSLTLEKKYPPYRVIRQVDNVDGKDQSEVYYKEVSSSLTDLEKAVFAKWKYNARHITLPLISLKEAYKIKVNGK